MSTTFYTLSVKNIKQETADTVSISFEIPTDLQSIFSFVPGQYLTLRSTIGGADIRRSYSICTTPAENDLRVAVKAIENGVFSTYAKNVLKVGDRLEVMPPMGGFKVNTSADNAKNYVFYAAGSGITPIMAMVKSILTVEPNSHVRLYYGNKNSESTIFKTELDHLKQNYSNFSLTYILSREETGSADTNGRITSDKCEIFFKKDQTNSTPDGIYACGPEEMIACVKDFYTAKGIDKSKIHFELFTSPVSSAEKTSTPESEAVQSDVTVIIDDESYSFSLNTKGKNILQAAQDEDADVPFSCKGGVCCTCKAKLLEGTVRMDLNFALEEDEVADGFILTCQSHPTSKKVVISFDEY